MSFSRLTISGAFMHFVVQPSALLSYWLHAALAIEAAEVPCKASEASSLPSVLTPSHTLMSLNKWSVFIEVGSFFGC